MTRNYGRAIRIMRAISGVSQTELARRVGIGASMVSLVESNKRTPSLRTLEKCAAALDGDLHTVVYLASPELQVTDILRRLAETGRAGT